MFSNSLLFACHCVVRFSCSASFDSKTLQPDTLQHNKSSATSSPASEATVSAPAISAGVNNPAPIALIVNTAKASLAAEKGPGSTSNNLPDNSASMALQSASGGVPASSLSLSQQMVSFLASGGTFSRATGDNFTFTASRFG